MSENNDIKLDNSKEIEDDSSRFRVDPINSSQLNQCSLAPSSSGFMATEIIHEEKSLELVEGGACSNGAVASSRSFLNQIVQPRRNSIAPGFGGGRKKSVVLPKDFDYMQEYERIGDDDSVVYGKTFAYYTREALPKLDHYKNLSSLGKLGRPTLDELRSEVLYKKKSLVEEEEEPSKSVKFGWIEGVLVRCLLNIWGVMLFLRLSWVVAQAGIGLAILIICLSAIVTTLTTLSMCAISTNGQVKGGGIYFMISRALGPEFGGAVGAIFSFANATAVAMHTVGFAESLNDLLKSLGTKIVDNGVNDIRIVGSIALVVMQCIIIIGTEWESKAQIVLLMILLTAIVDFLIGAFVGPMSNEEFTKGFVYFNSTVLASNFLPDFRKIDGVEHSFFSIFAIFFPSATGITAGANISGDLKDPSASIPKGTLLAIMVTTISYIIFALLSGAETLRDAAGPIYFNGTIDGEATNRSRLDWSFSETCNQLQNESISCKWGSQNSFQIMELISIFGPIIYAGCFAATLSSALACLVSAPKIFQALCKDKLYPGIEIFGKGFRKNNDPFFAYIVAFVIALAFILIADLNAVASLISNFYMGAYAMVNFCTFHAALVKPIGWRPTFRYYSTWSSLLGFVLCVAIMFLMSWVTALVTLAVLAGLFLILVYLKPEVNWGSSAQAQTFKHALNSVQSLNTVQDHVKNYHPQILVLSGRPSSRPTLIDFCYLITKNASMIIAGHILQERQSYKLRQYLLGKGNAWLTNHKTKAFYNIVDDVDFEEGARCLMQASGVGKLKPNILAMGFKSNWTACDVEEFKAYIRVIHDTFDNHLALAILRLHEGLDYSDLIFEDSEEDVRGLVRTDSALSGLNNLALSEGHSAEPEADSGSTDTAVEDVKKLKRNKNNKDDTACLRGPNGTPLPKAILNNLNQFQVKQRQSTIDIWWLYDDGGLTVLLPHIISTRAIFSGSKIRVFALANKPNDLQVEQQALASLLSKFRIKYSDLIVITDVMKKAKVSTKEVFDKVIFEYRRNHQGVTEQEMIISEEDLTAMREKTNRHLRLRELLLEHSRYASLVVMTLPMPRRNGSAPLYMAWLECLTKDMPPFLLVRGNQESVITYYS